MSPIGIGGPSLSTFAQAFTNEDGDAAGGGCGFGFDGPPLAQTSNAFATTLNSCNTANRMFGEEQTIGFGNTTATLSALGLSAGMFSLIFEVQGDAGDKTDITATTEARIGITITDTSEIPAYAYAAVAIGFFDPFPDTSSDETDFYSVFSRQTDHLFNNLKILSATIDSVEVGDTIAFGAAFCNGSILDNTFPMPPIVNPLETGCFGGALTANLNEPTSFSEPLLFTLSNGFIVPRPLLSGPFTVPNPSGFILIVTGLILMVFRVKRNNQGVRQHKLVSDSW